MARMNAARRLANYEQRYRELAAQLAEIGLIASGSRHPPLHPLRDAGLPLSRDPPQPHGPYCQWTTKVSGKTVTRRLTAPKRSSTREWIDNDRGCAVSSARCARWRQRPARSASRKNQSA